MNKELLVSVAKTTLVALALSYTASAQALFIELWTGDSTSQVRVEDNDSLGLDRSRSLGEVEYLGQVDDFQVAWSIGQSYPVVGSRTEPALELWTVEISRGAGSLNLLVMDDGFVLDDITTWDFGLGGWSALGDSTVTASAFVDLNNNQQMDADDQIISSLSGGGWSFDGTGDIADFTLSGNYAIGIMATVVHNDRLSITHFDASLSSTGTSPSGIGGNPTSVPEPSTLALMGIGLAGIGFFSRRRKPKT